MERSLIVDVPETASIVTDRKQATLKNNVEMNSLYIAETHV